MSEAEICGVLIYVLIGASGYIIGRCVNAFDEKKFKDFREYHRLVLKQMEKNFKTRQEDREGRLLESVKAEAVRFGITNVEADLIIAYVKQREAHR